MRALLLTAVFLASCQEATSFPMDPRSDRALAAANSDRDIRLHQSALSVARKAAPRPKRATEQDAKALAKRLNGDVK